MTTDPKNIISELMRRHVILVQELSKLEIQVEEIYYTEARLECNFLWMNSRIEGWQYLTFGLSNMSWWGRWLQDQLNNIVMQQINCARERNILLKKNIQKHEEIQNNFIKINRILNGEDALIVLLDS